MSHMPELDAQVRETTNQPDTTYRLTLDQASEIYIALRYYHHTENHSDSQHDALAALEETFFPAAASWAVKHGA